MWLEDPVCLLRVYLVRCSYQIDDHAYGSCQIDDYGISKDTFNFCYRLLRNNLGQQLNWRVLVCFQGQCYLIACRMSKSHMQKKVVDRILSNIAYEAQFHFLFSNLGYHRHFSTYLKLVILADSLNNSMQEEKKQEKEKKSKEKNSCRWCIRCHSRK